MTDRTCPGCHHSIEHLGSRFTFCSNACRRWIANGHTDVRPTATTCTVCQSPIVGRMATAIYCGRTCKSRAVEARRDRDDAARYIAERERRIEYAIAYAKANPHIGQAAKRRHRTARGVGFKFTGSDWLRTQRRFNNSCAYCGKTGPLTMDHVVPIIRGGTHGEGNIVPACRSCNCRKQGRFITEWKYGKSRKAQATT